MAYVGKTPKFDSTVLKDNTTSSVSNPPSGSSKLLIRNGSLYVKDSAGNESVAGGGAGELNLINDTITATNWAASGAGITVATSVAASELPLSPVVDTGIKITPVSGTDYVRYRFTLPEALYNTKLKVGWYQEALSGYASGDLKVEVYTNSASDYTGSYVELPLSSDSSGTSSIPSLNGQFSTTFDTGTLQYLELRIVRTAGTTALVLQNVVVGPGLTQQGAVITTWISYTPTASNFTIGNGTQEWLYRRVGTTIEVAGKVILGSTSSVSTVPTFTLPSGLTFDASALASVNGEYTNLGEANCLDSSGAATYSGAVYQNLTSSNQFYPSSQGNTSFTATVPFTWATSDWMTFNLKAPIAEWAGGGVVNLTQNDVEYAYTAGTWDADVSTTVYGPSGVLTGGALTTSRIKTVTWLSPVQVTDKISIEMSGDGVSWSDFSLFAPYSLSSAGTNATSAGVFISGSTATATQVGFARYKAIANDDVPAIDWPSSGLYWRAKKEKSGIAVGFGIASNGSSGLIPYYNTVTASLNNDFTSGTYTITRVGNVCTLMIINGGHSSSSTATCTGIPSWATPTNTQITCYTVFQGGIAKMLEVTTSGTFITRYYSANGTTANDTTANASGGQRPVISYIV
jgi:hypothetical protein